jgi:lipoprotein-anchoring transpeptidase ErfK/SrfK
MTSGTDHRLTTRTRLHPLLAGIVLMMVALVAFSGCASDTPPPSIEISETGTPATAPPGSAPRASAPPSASASTSSVIARPYEQVTAHAGPSASSPAITALAATTDLGSARALLVLDERDGWLEVSLPMRPNGSTGWIRADLVQIEETRLRIEIDLERRRLGVFDGDAVVEESVVAIGKPASPTPRGDFYVTDLVDTGSPGGPYGPFALGLSAYSEQLTEFAGGDGQVGIHGTNDPASIGEAVSHGCIRLPNDVVSRLIGIVGLGTPVTIV